MEAKIEKIYKIVNRLANKNRYKLLDEKLYKVYSYSTCHNFDEDEIIAWVDATTDFKDKLQNRKNLVDMVDVHPSLKRVWI